MRVGFHFQLKVLSLSFVEHCMCRPFTRITMMRETDLKTIDLCAMKNDQLHQHNSINEQFLFSDIKTETYVLRVSEQRVARANDV